MGFLEHDGTYGEGPFSTSSWFRLIKRSVLLPTAGRGFRSEKEVAPLEVVALTRASLTQPGQRCPGFSVCRRLGEKGSTREDDQKAAEGHCEASYAEAI